MISIKIPLHGLEESAIRPIIVSVIDDLKRNIGVSPDIYLQLTEDDKIKKKVNRLGELRGDNNAKDQWIEAVWEEITEPDMELSKMPINGDFKPIYQDPDVNSKIIPLYHRRRLNIRFKYYTISKSTIQAIANNLRVMTVNDKNTAKHDLEYHYTLGHFVSNLLIEINTLKNLREPEDKRLELEDYINKTFDDRVDLSYSYDGELYKSELIIKEAQLECVGFIEDDVYNIQPNYDDSLGQWTLEFQYVLTFEKPISLYLEYPILIYNSLIGEYYRTLQKSYKKNYRAQYTGRMLGVNKIIDKQNSLKPLTNDDFLTIPKNDVVKLPRTIRFLNRMFSVLCILNPDDLTELFNINDLPGLRFKEDIKAFLLNSEYPYIGKFLYSMFYIELYENNQKMMNIEVLLDPEGNLRTNKPLNIKKIYRVMFNVVNDLSRLDFNAQKRITKYIQDDIESKTVDGVLVGDPINFIYYNIFNVNTDYIDKYDRRKYATEDIKYGLKKPLWDTMRTKAYGTIIAMNYLLEEKEKHSTI